MDGANGMQIELRTLQCIVSSHLFLTALLYRWFYDITEIVKRNAVAKGQGKKLLYQEEPISDDMIKDMGPQQHEAAILSAIIRSPEDHHTERNVIDNTWTYGRQYSWMQHKYVILKNDLPDGKKNSLMERLSRLKIKSDVPTARYYLLVDDDCFVNTPYLLHAIKYWLPTASYILCAPRVSGTPNAAAPNDCDMTLPVLVSGDVVMAIQQLKKTQTGNNLPDAWYTRDGLVHFEKYLYLTAEDTELLVHGYYTVGRPMNYFFSAPLFSLNSTLAMPEMIIRLWQYAEKANVQHNMFTSQMER